MSKKYEQILHMFNLKQINVDPTRITYMSATLLDHILCSHQDKILQSGTLPIGLSDHLPIFCTRKMYKGQFNKHNTISIRSLKNYNVDDFIHKLKLCDWSSMFSVSSVDDCWHIFKDIFLSVLNTVAPIKEVRLKQRSEPWVDSNILDLIKKRDFYLYKFKKDKLKEYYTSYCSFRNIVQREVAKAKSDY